MKLIQPSRTLSIGREAHHTFIGCQNSLTSLVSSAAGKKLTEKTYATGSSLDYSSYKEVRDKRLLIFRPPEPERSFLN